MMTWHLHRCTWWRWTGRVRRGRRWSRLGMRKRRLRRGEESSPAGRVCWVWYSRRWRRWVNSGWPPSRTTPCSLCPLVSLHHSCLVRTTLFVEDCMSSMNSVNFWTPRNLLEQTKCVTFWPCHNQCECMQYESVTVYVIALFCFCTDHKTMFSFDKFNKL